MDAALAATGLDRHASSEPTVVTPRPVIEDAPRAKTEVMSRPAGRGPSTKTLAAITAFLLTAAIAALIVLYLQNRTPAGSLNGNLPSPSIVSGSGTTTAPSASPSTTPKPV